MKRIPCILRKTIYITSAILAGLSIFTTLLSFNLNNTVFSPEYHKKLFEQNQVYTKVHDELKNSLSEYVKTLNTYSPQNLEQQTYIFSLLEKSLTPQMVRSNLDSLREGLFQYFNGSRTFLPDISLNMGKDQEEPAKEAASQGTAAVQALSRIDKVNLSAVLMYINRNDITDDISVAKLVYFIFQQLPSYGIIFYIFFAMLGIASGRKLKDAAGWFPASWLACGVMLFAASAVIWFYTNTASARNMLSQASFLPMPGSALMSYINGCFKPLFILSLISGTVFLLLSVVVLVSLTKILGNIYTLEYVPYSIRLENRRLLAVRLLYVAFFAVIAANIGFKIQHTSKIYVQNGFPATAALLRSPNNVKQVIAAKDDGIYSLQVKLVDRKSSMPVNNVNINVNGKSSIQDRYYNESKATSDEGTAKFILDKGDFRLSFKGSDFPDEYQIPSPFYFNLETAGTTIITVSLDAASERNPGIAEIELLDSRNAPVSGIQLAVTETQPTHENTVNTFSYTNSEGIAVFKMKEGKYQVSFLQADFPQNFLLPSPIDVDITADSVKRYTLKLVEIKQ